MKKICMKDRKYWSLGYGPDCGEEVTVIGLKDFYNKTFYILAEYEKLPLHLLLFADQIAYLSIHFIDAVCVEDNLTERQLQHA